MPIYEYRCRACDREFEEWLRSADDASDVTCPGCSSRQVERRLSVFAARQGGHASSSAPPGPCGGRCGDPNGSCPAMGF